MSWHSPISWSGTPTATQLTEQLYDNLLALYNAPSVRVFRNDSSSSLTSGSAQTLGWNAEDWDTDSMWEAGSPYVLTATTAGRYLHGFFVEIQASAAKGRRGAWIVTSGADTTCQRDVPNASGYLDACLNAEMYWPLSATATIETRAYQNSGGPLNIQEDSAMWAHWVGV